MEVEYTFMAKIKTIKLSDGSVYSIFDEGALRLNSEGKLVTGNAVVDKAITIQGLSIVAVDNVPVEQSISNVATFVQESGVWKLKQRSTEKLLEDIGGTSHSIENNTLILKVGK